MHTALAVAQQALPLDVPVGAVLLNAQGEELARACNTRERDQDPLGHAELNVLRAAAQALGAWRLSGCTLYVTLEPCPMCASALLQARVSTVIFGAYDPVMGAAGSKYHLFANASQVSLLGGVLETECTEALRAFFQTMREKSDDSHAANTL